MAPVRQTDFAFGESPEIGEAPIPAIHRACPTERGCPVPLQDLMDHTSYRLLSSKLEALALPCDLILTSEWGFVL